MPKPTLLLISDLLGFKDCEWIQLYVDALKEHYKIALFDTLEAAEILPSKKTKQEIHAEYLAGGLEKAVNSLMKSPYDSVDIIGFSIGGTVAWQASNRGFNFGNFLAVSATRLRHESVKPIVKISLLYGENDIYQPSDEWCKNLNITKHIISNAGHDMYKQKKLVSQIVKTFIP